MSSNGDYIFCPGKDIALAPKAFSYTAKALYIRQWLGIEEPEMFEAIEEILAGAEAEVDYGNASKFSEISLVVAWAVWQNFTSSPQGMDHEYFVQTEIEDDCASQFSDIPLGRVWTNPALRQTEEDFDNASEFSEIPLALVLQNTEIEDDLFSQFSEISLSHLWPNAYGPIANPTTNSKVQGEKDDFSGTYQGEERMKEFGIEVNPAEVFEKRDKIGDIALTGDETDNGCSANGMRLIPQKAPPSPPAKPQKCLEIGSRIMKMILCVEGRPRPGIF
ncbi:hypothetical protein RUND412_002682 [Rhizina undulata]